MRLSLASVFLLSITLASSLCHYAQTTDNEQNEFIIAPAWLHHNWRKDCLLYPGVGYDDLSLTAQSGAGIYLGYTRKLKHRWAIHLDLMLSVVAFKQERFQTHYSSPASKRSMRMGSTSMLLQYEIFKNDHIDIYLGAGANIMIAEYRDQFIGKYWIHQWYLPFRLKPTNRASTGWALQGGLHWYLSKKADLLIEMQHIRNGVYMDLYNTSVPPPGRWAVYYKIDQVRIGLNPTVLMVGVNYKW